uniref:Uncharacterized protein LOC100179406 n=1 Tax=Phallusia mammillata TaxID=59560 RepID=A0A6F9DHX3_9ASCI|nr:uncharacterized protein LOC100179406 [Phallusia mammillata]
MLKFFALVCLFGLVNCYKFGKFGKTFPKVRAWKNDNNAACEPQCKNHATICKVPGIIKLCKTQQLVKVMEKNCPLLCGFCKPCSRGCIDPKCKDQILFCPAMATKKNCNTDPNLRQLCRKSCGTCPACPKTQQQKLKCSKDCIDSSTKCKQYASIREMCGDDSPHYDFMQKHCKLSCKLCRKCNLTMARGKQIKTAKLNRPTTRKQECRRDVASESTVEAQCLGAHNFFRCLHGSPPLNYDLKLANQARRYAIHLAESGKPGDKGMEHSKKGVDRGNDVGENLAWRWAVNNRYNVSQAISDWYTGEMQYDFDKPGFSNTTGHFTQLVWKDTQSVGCAIARVGHEVYVVAQYSKKGNSPNGFAHNVQRLKSDVCEAKCKAGTCQGQDANTSTCKCTGPQNNTVPECTKRCVAYCPKPMNHIGSWLERCEGSTSCKCISSKKQKLWPGAQCI